MRAELAFNRFLVDAKSWWISEMFAALRAEYEARAEGKSVRTPEEVAALLEDSALYPYRLARAAQLEDEIRGSPRAAGER